MNLNKKLLRAQRGQIIILMMFAMVPLVLLMAYVFNGGYLVAQKTKLQNSADTAALVEASWTARTLNIMSMNNTALTQSQAITSTAFALEKPLLDAGLASGLVAGFYAGRAVEIAIKCPPWCTLIAPIVYTAMYAALNERVLNPLTDLQVELKRAIHTKHDQGFAKAAASFGRMNKILDEKFPLHIEKYSDALVAKNYDESVQVNRYTAWAEVDKTHRVQIPVVRQSFREALSEIAPKAQNEEKPTATTSGETQAKLQTALTKIKDIRDVEVAGLFGTHENPYNFPSFNYFGNFKNQGYELGTGPFKAGRGRAETEFDELFKKLEGHIDGTFVADEIRKKLENEFGGCFVCKWIVKLVIRIFELIFSPLLGTAYENQATNQEDLAIRLNEVWQWSARYGESHYSNSFDVSGKKDLGLFTVSAPPRMWRGLAPGFIHGRDLTNLFDNALDSINREIEALEDDFGNECVKEYLPARIIKLQNEEIARREARYQRETQAAIDNMTEIPDRNSIVELSDDDIKSIESLATAQVEQECKELYEDKFKNPKNTNTDTNTNENPYGDTDEHQGGGSSNDPKGVQDNLERINWLFEPAYQLIKLSFPLDAALFAFIGSEYSVASDRSRPDPNWWCGYPFRILTKYEGTVCVNETPMYAVRGQRLYPEFFSDKLKSLGGQDLVNAFSKTYAADRKDWSVLISVTAPAELYFTPGGFGRVPETMSAIAQAEVYNAQWFDLFTQSWKSKLTPVTLLKDDRHVKEIEKKWKDKVNFTELFPVVLDKKSRILTH